METISHFARFAFSCEKNRKVLNVSTRFLMGCASFKRKFFIICIWIIKEAVLEYFYTFHFECFLIRRNKNSNISMERYAETGSPWREPLSMLKYCVVVLAFITDDRWSINNISIQMIIFFPKPDIFKTEIRKIWSRKPKDFSISIVTRKPVLLN